jgi:hypothetical protein
MNDAEASGNLKFQPRTQATIRENVTSDNDPQSWCTSLLSATAVITTATVGQITVTECHH